MVNNLKKAEVQEGIVLIILSALIINKATEYNKFGSIALSPALVPISIACIIALLSVLLIIKGIRSEQAEIEGAFIDRWKNPALVSIATVIFLVILPIVHFLPASVLFLVALLLILGERKWYLLLLIPVLTTGLIYGLFSVFLSVRLP